MTIDFLKELNPAQQQAVTFDDGASLVIAGAGSGKTRVLTYKIAYLIQSGHYPSSLLALTFTNKAAREMKERISRLVGEQEAARLWMGTFHSVFLRILRVEKERLGYTAELTIYDSSDSKSLLRTIIKEMQLDDKIYKPNVVQSRISMAKNSLVTPTAYAEDREVREYDMRSKMPRLSDIYRLYWQRCKNAGAMDFDDLLFNTYLLFNNHPDILDKYRSRFRYILVDEYQDTNYAQHAIVKQLAEDHGRVFVVGDDAQSIYSFRGANIDNIINFKSTFPNCRLFKLEQNYRSTQTIVNAANSVIKRNKNQIFKQVFSEKEEGEKIRLFSAFTDIEEGMMVANKLAEMRHSLHHSYNDFVILYRTNAQSRILEESLRKKGIPYRVYGGLSFYQRKEIKDVVAYLRLTINPHDEEAFKRVINYPGRGIGDTTVNKIKEAATLHEVSLWRVLTDPMGFNLNINAGTAKKLASFGEILSALHEKNTTDNAAEVTEFLLKRTGILADLFTDATPEGMSKQQNIQELMNGVIDFCRNKQEEGSDQIKVSDFLAEVSLASDQDSGEEDTERVTMMTIHAAKGLEFRNVFIVGLEEDLFPSLLAKQSERELEEERRLFYVAITRAGENCILTYAKSRFRNGQTTLTNQSSFVKDIDPSYLQLAGNTGLAEHHVARPMPMYKGWRSDEFTSNNERNEKNGTEQKEKPTVETTYTQPATRKLTPISQTSSPQSSALPTVKEGQVIRHNRFGEGRVLRLEDVGDNAKMVVLFNHSGEKKLLLKFVRFTIVE